MREDVVTLSLIRQQVRVLRAIGLEPQSSESLGASPPDGMRADDVPVAIAVLAAAKRIVLDDDGCWCLRGTVGMKGQHSPELRAAIESMCRVAELQADATEATERGDFTAAAKAMADLLVESARGVKAARAADAARRK